MLPQDQSQMDSSVLNLMSGIRQVESQGNYAAKGKSGEYGAYQFTQPTWKGWAQKYLGDGNADWSDPANQNKVAYARISDLKKQGFKPDQIASIWNSGKADPSGNVGTNSMGVNYDTPKYVANVLSAAQQSAQSRRPMAGNPSGGGIIPTANAQTMGQPPQQSPQQPTQQDQGPSVSGFIGNVANSAGGVLSGLGQAAMHPIKTAETAMGTVAGGAEKMFGVKNNDTDMFDNAVKYFGQRYGGSSPQEIVHNVLRTAYKDPVGVALDLSTLFDGIGAAAGGISKLAKVGELGDVANTASKVGEVAKTAGEFTNPITPITKAAGGILNTGKSVVRSISSKIIGLSDPASITNVLKDPEQYSKMAMEQVNRGSLADEFGKSLDSLEQSKSEAGAAYNPIKEGKGTIAVPENWLSDILSKGTSADEGGKAIPFKLQLEPEMEKLSENALNETEPAQIGHKVKADTTSFTRDSSDIKAIQHFVDTWGMKKTLTPEEFLNMRQDAAKMGKFGRDIGRNDGAELVGRAIRADANKTMRNQVPGLSEADTTAAPLISKFSQAKKTFLTKGADGSYEFKPGAANKIANAAGKGKDDLLKFMEEVSPGISKKIQVLKTVEDIESAYKMKVGTYAKGVIEGGSLLTGNIPMLVASIISHPAIAVPLLRGAGYTARTVAPITSLLRLIAGDPQIIKYYAQAGKLANQAPK